MGAGQVGWKTAERLWDALGEEVYGILERREGRRLAEIVGIDLASAILQGFGLLADDVRVFRWFDRHGVCPRTAAAAAAVWGAGAVEKIEADPYALTLLERWAEVDERALRLGLPLDDERRLLAAVEEAGSKASAAFELGVRTGRLIRVSADTDEWQTRAPWAMERTVERRLRERLSRPTPAPGAGAVAAAIAAVERDEGFRFTKRQREAVHMAVSSPVSVIAGGAGTGETSIIKAVLLAGEARDGEKGGEHRGAFP